MGDRQPQPCSTLFRGKKGVEDVVQAFLIHSPTGVRNFDLDEIPLGLFYFGCLYEENSFLSDGLGGIQE